MYTSKQYLNEYILFFFTFKYRALLLDAEESYLAIKKAVKTRGFISYSIVIFTSHYNKNILLMKG